MRKPFVPSSLARLTEEGSPLDPALTSDEQQQLRMTHLIRLGSQNDPKLQLYMEQHGRCGVCKRAYPPKLLCIDHDHETQLIRGLLCHRCNTREAISDDNELVVEFDGYRQASPAQGRWKYQGLSEFGRPEDQCYQLDEAQDPLLREEPQRGKLVGDPLSTIPVDPEIERRLNVEATRMRELLDKAFSPSTRRNYAADWRSFCSWCGERDFPSLPATPTTVAQYLVWLIDRSAAVIFEKVAKRDGSVTQRPRLQKAVKPSTLRRHLASIRSAHLADDLDDPTTSFKVRALARGIALDCSSPLLRKTRFKDEDVRVALSSHSFDRLIDKRDRAIILFGWSSAFLRSEIAALDFEHIHRGPHGIDISRSGRRRTDDHISIHYSNESALCAIAALDAWFEASGIKSGAAFRRVDRHGNVGDRIAGEVVAAVTKRFARAAGLDERQFAAHSLRKRINTGAAYGQE